jgi:hypothetical protein
LTYKKYKPGPEHEVVQELMKVHGYTWFNANPLVHQTINKLQITAITEQTKERIIQDILTFHPILVKVDKTNR